MTRPTIKTNEWERGPYMDRVKRFEPAPVFLPRWACALVAILLVVAGLLMIGSAFLP